MKVNHIVATEKTRFIIEEISLSGVVETGQNITTPYEVEVFDNETDWQTRKNQLGITEDEEILE